LISPLLTTAPVKI